MELHSAHKTIHQSHLGEQKHEMLSLNRRLETYLNRVKLLEEENALLAKEIQAIRHSNHGAMTRRKGLKEELKQARLEVDAAWRERVHTEMEIARLTEELQTLDLQRQKEAQAQAQARAMLMKSKKELEEEQRAQIWLREKVSQLENEMRLLIQTHQEDVAHFEATLTHSRVTVPPALAQRGKQRPNVLQLGQEYTQMASRAWQEVSDGYHGQLAGLEESLHQTRVCLAQVNQEKCETQVKLQALQKEIVSAQDFRLHLEKTAAQQRDKHSQEIQVIQEHMEGLEVEKEELGQQINHLLLENRGLLQLKMSLGLEVATYRALLDSESLRGDNFLLNQPRNVSVKDADFFPEGVKKNYQTQLSANHKATSLSSVCGLTGTGPTVITAKPVWSRQPVTFSETPKVLRITATKSTKCEASYPKILQEGAVENFRPQEVHEKITQAEPLSPPNEDEVVAITTSVDKDFNENCNSVDVETDESPVMESDVSFQLESGLSSELPFNDEDSHHLLTTSNLTTYFVRMTEKSCGLLDEPDKDVGVKGPSEQPHAPNDALVKKEGKGGEEVEQVQEETSDSETEAVLEPTFESRTSSPTSECEPEESVLNQFTHFNQEESIPNVDVVKMRQEISSSLVETNVEEKLYPDGEEMDTWDSVIEKREDVRMDDGIIKDEAKRQHAVPEEDISAREPGHEKRDTRQDFATDVEDNKVTSSVKDTQVYDDDDDDDDAQHAALDQEHVLLPGKEEGDDNDDDEDSQNVSVSWRMEVEGDSYAQDNTLADTRPLIRYKSDETDANTHASHMDESESSEGEQRIEETGMWSENKSKKFGTMEDLCEEVEGEVLDEEYDMGYTHTEDGDVDRSLTTSKFAKSMKDTENAEEGVKNVSEGQSNEETKLMVPKDVDYDEELETDRLVEQELENLCTDGYSAHFAQQLASESPEMVHLQGNYPERMTEQEEAGTTQTEAMSSSTEPEENVTHELSSSTTIVDYENLHFSDSSVVMPQIETLADDETKNKDHNAIDAPEKREEDEHNVSMVTHANDTEDAINDFISRPDMEEINNSADPNSVLQENVQDVTASLEVKEVAPVEVSNESQERLAENVADSQSFLDLAEGAEWDVLENLSEDFDVRDETEYSQIYDNVSESAESYHHHDKTSDEAIMTHKEKGLESSPCSAPNENDIFVVKDSTELLNQSGTDNNLHDVFSSGTKKDFWVSSVETGATYQEDDTCNQPDEQTNQSLGFEDNLVWGNLENQNVVNGNSRVDIESTKALAAEEEQGQMHSEVKQVLSRHVVEGELVHSEESDVEGESWSSGEETV